MYRAKFTPAPDPLSWYSLGYYLNGAPKCIAHNKPFYGCDICKGLVRNGTHGSVNYSDLKYCNKCGIAGLTHEKSKCESNTGPHEQYLG